MTDLALEGCRPIPLASYLKALGVLRLVAEQADPGARGWWEGDCFWLRSNLDRDGLVRFFLEDYSPTPIIAPWNGGSGFYPKDSKVGIAALQGSTLDRFTAYRDAIGLGAELIRERNLGERPTDQAKSELIAALRAEAGHALVTWIDAAVALTLDRTAFPPLLGTGGNDGRLDFTNNFMQRLTEVIPPDGGHPPHAAGTGLDDALFAEPVVGLSSAAIGQFAPGAAGGPNSSTGFQGNALVNGWDFVLMLEGALVFAGGVSRRLEGADMAYLTYPFTVRATAAGYGSASLDEQGDARGELWVPLWRRPATYAEMRALFREGRLSLGARPARDGLDAARAVGTLGVNRGIAVFERYGFVKRQGLAYLAAPLGRRQVEANPRGDLISELDRGRWLEWLRRKANSDEVAADLREAVRTLQDGIFALLGQPGDRRAAQDVLIACGLTARTIAIRPKLRDALRPPPLLSSRWVEAADDGSPEFRIALALAGTRARTTANETGESRSFRAGLPMRSHFGPLDPDQVNPQWNPEQGGALVVWGTGPLEDNLCAVAQRRLLEQSREGWPEVPFNSGFDEDRNAPVAVDSGEIAAFIDRRVYDKRLANLLLGLAWVRPGRYGGERHVSPLPFPYAALKPLFTPHSVFGRLKLESYDFAMPPALPSLLAAGRVQEAVRLGQERVRASGLPAPFLQIYRSSTRVADVTFGRRLLAALIIPVRDSVVRTCLDQAYPSSDQETSDAT